MKKWMKALIVALTVLTAATGSHAQGLNALMGGALGAAVGGAANRNAGGAVVGGIIGVAMATILQQLSQEEQQKRQAALQSAARGRSANWSSGKKGAKATYVNKGKVARTDGRNCSKVEETITLPDGKQGKSTETVCFS